MSPSNKKNRYLPGYLIAAWVGAMAVLWTAGWMAGVAAGTLQRITLYVSVFLLFLLLPRNAQVVVGSMLAGLLFLEVGLRVHDGWLRWRYPDLSFEEHLWEHDSLLGWRKKANYRYCFTNRENRIRTIVRTNSRGLRDREFSQNKPDSLFRILMIGNSSLVGLEVERDELIDTRLEALINADSLLKPCEIINAGTRGYGTDQCLLYLERRGAAYHPDCVVYLYTSNDLSDNLKIHNPGRLFGKPWFAENDSGVFRPNGIPVPRRFTPHDSLLTIYPEPMSVEAPATASYAQPQARQGASLLESIKDDLAYLHVYRDIRRRVRASPALRDWLLRAAILEQWPPPGRAQFPGHPPADSAAAQAKKTFALRHLENLLRRMKSVTDSLDIPLVVYEMVNGWGEWDGRPSALSGICRRLQIHYIDTYRVFHTRAEGKARYRFRTDGHWNAAGHALAAECMYGYVRKEKLVPRRDVLNRKP